MAKIREILRRRKTARNIRKITRTMEMIATSRYRRVHTMVRGLHPYAEGLLEMVKNVSQRAPRSKQPLLKQHPKVHRDAVIVIAANRGMCGGYNAGLVRAGVRRIRELTGQGRQVDVYAIGTRTLAGLRQARIEPVWHAKQYEGRVMVSEVAELTQLLMKRFSENDLGTVEVIYTQFISSTRQQPVVELLLPLGELQKTEARKGKKEEKKEAPPEESKKKYIAHYLFMPTDPAKVLRELLPRTVVIRMYKAFLDALASEYVARMTAMRTATENAEDMARQLTMQYNRARQGNITRELAEIVGGAEALKKA